MTYHLLNNEEVKTKFREAFGNEKFNIALLVDIDGLVIDVIGEGYDPDMFSATSAVVQQCVDSIRSYTGVSSVDEVTLNLPEERVKLVYRRFEIDSTTYFLVLVFPLKTFYRKLSNELVRIIQRSY